MRPKNAAIAILSVMLLFSGAHAQKAEVTVSLNEQFFDALLEAVFANFEPPQFSIAQNGPTGPKQPSTARYETATFTSRGSTGTVCDESIKVLREMNGVRTAVRFREGKVYVPLAFSGSYEPPFVGCVDFAGWAESNIDLEFDQTGQRLIGRIHVLNVNLNGSGGIGGSLIAKMLQRSIDKKMNPIEILKLDKISFMLPVPNAGNLKMRAFSAHPEIASGAINVRIGYEFIKP